MGSLSFCFLMAGYDAAGGSGKSRYKSLISPAKNDLRGKVFAP